MAWNEPGKSGKDRDPWGNKGNQGPPDLDEALRNISNRLGGIFGGGGGSFSSIGITLLLLLAIVVWVISGFYTIREAEKGVVLRFGQFYELVDPGLHWRPAFVDDYYAVDVNNVNSMPTSGFMLTEDENLIRVEMEVQYRVSDPYDFLFNVTNPIDSLRQSMDAALRHVVGHTTMDNVLSVGRETVRAATREELERVLIPYNTGLEVVGVNFLPARPPEQVKDAFDDAVAAQEDEQRFINEARAYALELEPKARGRAKRMLEEAEAYKDQSILKAQGEVARFNQLLPQYIAAPEVTRQRLYLEAMERVYSRTSKILVDVEGNNSMFYLPLDKLMQQHQDSGYRPSSRDTKSVIPSSSGNDPSRINRSSRSSSRQGRD